jgi:hypothetical protein
MTQPTIEVRDRGGGDLVFGGMGPMLPVGVYSLLPGDGWHTIAWECRAGWPAEKCRSWQGKAPHAHADCGPLVAVRGQPCVECGGDGIFPHIDGKGGPGCCARHTCSACKGRGRLLEGASIEWRHEGHMSTADHTTPFCEGAGCGRVLVLRIGDTK